FAVGVPVGVRAAVRAVGGGGGAGAAVPQRGPAEDVARGPGRAAPGRPTGADLTDVRLQPVAQRAGGAEEVDDPLLRGGGAEPGADRPLLPRDETLAAQQIRARMVLRVPARHGLEAVVRGGVDALAPELRDEIRERGTGPVVGHRFAEPGQLSGVGGVPAILFGGSSP